MFHNIVSFYGEELLVSRPTPKLEDHNLSAVRDCSFGVLAATLDMWRPFLHPQPEGTHCCDDRDVPISFFLLLCSIYKFACFP